MCIIMKPTIVMTDHSDDRPSSQGSPLFSFVGNSPAWPPAGLISVSVVSPAPECHRHVLLWPVTFVPGLLHSAEHFLDSFKLMFQ